MKVVQLLPGMRRAGAETVTSSICRALASAGHEVHLVIVGSEFEYRAELKDSRVEVHRLNLFAGDLRFYDLPARLRVHHGLEKCLWTLKPDIVHAHLTDALIWASPVLRKLHVPTFYTQHGMDCAFQDKGLIAWWRRWQFVQATHTTRCYLLAVSSGVARYTERHLGIKNGAIAVLPNPIDLTRFFPRKELASPRSVILMLGTLYSLKRVHIGIRALEYLSDFPSVVLQIAGDGPDRKILETQAARSPARERIRFLGVRRDTEELFQTAGMLWLLSEREGLPMAALEAMACGTPVVATNVAATNELVVDGVNGLLVPLDDARAVAEATRKLMYEPTLQQGLIEGGLRTAQQHSVEVIVPMLEAYYQRTGNGAL